MVRVTAEPYRNSPTDTGDGAFLARLLAAATRLAGEVDEARVPRLVVEEAARLVGARGVMLALLDYEPEWLVIREALGTAARAAGRRRASRAGVLGQVLQTGASLRCPTDGQVRRTPPGTPALGALLVVPLRFKGEVLGALQATRPPAAGPFNAREEQALQLLADLAAARMGASDQAAALRARAQELAVLDPAWRPPLDQAGDFVLVVKNRRQVIDADEAACRILDYPRELLLQCTLADLVPLPPWADRVDNLGGIRAQMMRESVTFDTLVRRRDGTLLPVRLELRVFPQPDGFVSRGVLRDLSREKRAQAQAIQSEKMRLLEEIGAGLAHELNTPLAVVLGNLEMALAELADPDLRALLLPARGAAERIALTVRQVHRFAQPIVPSAWSALDLSRLAWEVVQETRPLWEAAPTAEGRTIRLELDAPPVSPIWGDAAELREALRELIANAVQALPHGGTIRVATTETASEVQVSVSDDGVGMSAEVRQFCMEPFYTTRRPHGTGLGLNRVYHTALRHRGHVQIDSAEGEGTRVTIGLPRAPS